jgi:glycosidase
VFVRSFADSDGDGIGDFAGLTARLDYIADLGANCIWLMPVSEGASYHGYDVVDYYAVEQDYGTIEEFRDLMAAARERDIRVIVDLVLNHTGIGHPWFQSALNDPQSPYRDWYLWSPANPAYQGPWGQSVWYRSPVREEYYYAVFWQGMPDLNYRNPAVTAEALRISDFWLNDLGVDGFRLDAVKHIVEAGREQENTRETHAWLREYASGLRGIKADVFTVGEVFDGRPGVLERYYPDQLDTYFEFGVSYAIIDAARTGDAARFTAAVAGAMERIPFQRWAPFLTNHDQERVMTTLGGDQGKMRIAAMALLTLPGVPFLYYGEEIGMTGAKPDERLRTPMQWSGEPGAGFTTGAPWEALQPDFATVNVAAQEADADSLLNHYRTLIRLHRATPALAQGDFLPLNVEDARSVAAFVRGSEEGAVLVALNFGAAPAAGMQLAGMTGLAPGSYACASLFGAREPATLTVDAQGAIAGYAGLPELPAYDGLICALQPAR